MHDITCGNIGLMQNAVAKTTYVQSNGSYNQLIVKGSDYILGYNHSPFIPTLVTYLGYNFPPFLAWEVY